MKIGTGIRYSKDFHTEAGRVVELEQAGLDAVWVSEAYSVDAVSRAGYLAAVTDRVEIGTGILNVFSRTASAIAQTAVGIDMLSNGRFILGLGASGPQVIEGFHGVPYEQPVRRIKDYIEVTRIAARRERIVHDGDVIQVPLPEGLGTGLGKPLKLVNHPVRPVIPIWWAALMPWAVRETVRHADGWIPAHYLPDEIRTVWGDDIDRAMPDRPADLGALDITKSCIVAIGDEYVGAAADAVLDQGRPPTALYWGGMGARDKNFYNTIARQMGFEAEAEKIQDLYLDGYKDDAAASVPRDFLDRANLVGPASVVKERLALWNDCGVTMINASFVGDDGNAVATLAQLRALIDDL